MKLLPHQEQTLAFYTQRQKAGLKFAADFSETGTGKSLPALQFTTQLLGVTPVRPVLYVTLAGLKAQLHSEATKHYTGMQIPVLNLTGSKVVRDELYASIKLNPKQLVILNYEQLLNDRAQIAELNPQLVIADECTRLAAHNNKSRLALMDVIPKDCFRIGMTGTPVSNNPLDLWGIMDFLSPGLMGNYFGFVQKFCVKPKGYNFIVGYRDTDVIKRQVDPHYIRHMRESVLDLKGITRLVINFELESKERKFYNQLRDGFIKEIREQLKVKQPWNLEQIMLRVAKLLEVCDDASLVSTEFGEGKSSKMRCLQDLLETLPEDDHVVIFSRFSRMTKILGAVLNAPVIDGDTPQAERTKILAEFQDSKHRVLVFSNAGAYGLNVQRANIVIHYDQPQSVAQAVQRTARAYRYLQTKPVLEYFLLGVDTYEFKAQQKLTSKLLLADELLQEQSLVDSAEELINLL